MTNAWKTTEVTHALGLKELLDIFLTFATLLSKLAVVLRAA